jgi:hypothetical protein
MAEYVDEIPDIEALLKRSKTRANRLFYVVIALSAIIFIFFGASLVDKIRALTAGVSGSYAAAEKQSELWRKNISCVGAPPNFVDAANNLKVDATICSSGDIFVHVITPDNREVYQWVSVEDMARRPGEE